MEIEKAYKAYHLVHLIKCKKVAMRVLKADITAGFFVLPKNRREDSRRRLSMLEGDIKNLKKQIEDL